VVLSVVAVVLVWTFSDSRATTQRTAPPPRALPAVPGSVPGTLTEVWRAPSAATPVPVATDATVVTGSDGEVAGRDPLTGAVRWSYTRDLRLCTVGSAWSSVLALYRKDTGCSEVTELDPGTGRRTAQRNGDAEPGARLVAGDSHVTTTGEHLLNTWRNDLVKTMEYGRVFAQVNPDRQPRTGCRYGTVAVAEGRVGVIEHCPGESGARLTVLKAAGDEADTPEQIFSSLLPEHSAQLVAMTGNATAVALPQQRRLLIFDKQGMQRVAYPLDVSTADLERAPAGGVAPTARGPRTVYWFTGSATVALSAGELRPRWTAHGTLGPGTSFAGHYVVPVPGGLAVLDERTGATIRTVAVHRSDDRAPIRLASAGPVLLEQRGNTLVALR
jgi:hypothetical protein